MSKVFTKLFDQDVCVGEILLTLVYDKSKDALKESAQELLDVLMNNLRLRLRQFIIAL